MINEKEIPKISEAQNVEVGENDELFECLMLTQNFFQIL